MNDRESMWREMNNIPSKWLGRREDVGGDEMEEDALMAETPATISSTVDPSRSNSVAICRPIT